MFKKLLPILSLNLVNILGFTMLIPVLPEVLNFYTGESSGIAYGMLLSAYALSQFVASPILGQLSDMYGRKPILIISQTGTLISWVIFGSAYFISSDTIIFGIQLPLIVIAFSRITDGLTGGNISVAYAWTSDVIEPNKRTKAFGLMGAIFGVGFLFGPSIGGISVSSEYSFLGTAIVAFCISLITLIMMFKLPESLPASERVEKRKLHVLDEINIFKKFQIFKENKPVYNLLYIRLLYSFIFVGFTTSIILFLQRQYGLSAMQIGLLLSSIGVGSIINQGFVVPKLSEKIHDFKLFLLGVASTVLGFSLLTTLPFNGEDFTVFICILFLFYNYFINLGISLSLTSFKSILVNNVDQKRLGLATGLDESISSFGQGVTPLFAGALYDFLGFMVFGLFAIMLAIFSGIYKLSTEK